MMHHAKSVPNQIEAEQAFTPFKSMGEKSF